MDLILQVRLHSLWKWIDCAHFALCLHDIQGAAAILVDLNRLCSWYVHLKLLGEMTSSSVPPQWHVYNLFTSKNQRNTAMSPTTHVKPEASSCPGLASLLCSKDAEQSPSTHESPQPAEIVPEQYGHLPARFVSAHKG
jgi:hypothetical protein